MLHLKITKKKIRDNPHYPRSIKNTAYVVTISIVAALGGLLFGYDTAVISGAIGFLRTYFNLNSYEMGWAASCALAGCVAGVALAGFLSDKFGRKKILLLAAILFAISAIGSAVPKTITQLIIFRIIGGFGVGIASMLSPLYIAEIAPARMRGRLVSINQFAIVSGILLVYFVNYFITDYTNESWNIDFGWRWMFASETLPALLFFILLFFVPESPRWLVQKNRNDEALNILSKINEPKKAKAELSEIENSGSKDDGSLSRLLTPGIRIILIIGIVLAILQQVTGINVFLYYGPEIFKNLGSGTNAALLQTIIVGTVNLSFTIIAILVVDKIGRKPLLVLGFSGMGISLVCLGLAAYFQNTGLWVLIFILGYIASFAVAIGPVTWVVLSEIFPNKIRGRAMGLATVFLWIANFVVSQTFPIINENEWLVNKFHHGFSFWIYAFMCVVSVIFVSRWIPETKGKSLEEIEKMWK